MQDGIGHAVERVSQLLDLIVAAYIGACGQIAAGYPFHDPLEAVDRPHKVAGPGDRRQQPQEDAHDGQQAGTLVHVARAAVVGFERQPNVNPAPLNPVVIEGCGIVKQALVEHWHDPDRAGWTPHPRTPVRVDIRLRAPAVALDDQRVAVVLGDHQKIHGRVLREDLHGMVDNRRVVLCDRGAGDFAVQGRRDAAGFRLQLDAQVTLLFGNDDRDKNGERSQRH